MPRKYDKFDIKKYKDVPIIIHPKSAEIAGKICDILDKWNMEFKQNLKNLEKALDAQKIR